MNLPARRRIWTLEPMAWIAVIVVASGLRLAGMFNEFWLDEIWSWEIAGQITDPVEIIYYRDDNNHWLNTFWIYALGQQQPLFVYRTLSLAAGIGSVLVAGFIGRTYGWLQGWLSLLLTGMSYMLIHYSSEARGYAPAVFFALVCVWLMRQQEKAPRLGRGLLFGCCAALGFLAHLTFLFIYAGLALWSLTVFWRRFGLARTSLAHLLVMHVLPLAMFAFLYHANVRHTQGQGDARSMIDVFQQFLVWGFGMPDKPTGFVVAAFFKVPLPVRLIVGTAGCLALLILSYRRGQDDGIFYVCGCVLSPFGLLVVSGRDDLYPRYFLLILPFLLILGARVLAWGFTGGSLRRVLSGLALLVFVAGNAQQVKAFLEFGRGHYREALDYCIDNTPTEIPVTLGSDNDFRNGVVISWYLRLGRANGGITAAAEKGAISCYLRLEPPARRVFYLKEQEWTSTAPYWIITHDFDQQPHPAVAVHRPGGYDYDLVQQFRHAGASGWNWYLYRIK